MELLIKRFVRKVGGGEDVYWVLFRQGDIRNPIQIIPDYEVDALIELVKRERRDAEGR